MVKISSEFPDVIAYVTRPYTEPTSRSVAVTLETRVPIVAFSATRAVYEPPFVNCGVCSFTSNENKKDPSHFAPLCFDHIF